MPKLEGSYGVRDGFDGETHEEALDKVEDKRSKIESEKERFRSAFESEMEEEFPRHPFKVMMDLRRDLGLYRHFRFTQENSVKLKALEELKDEFEDRWKSLASGGDSS